MKVILITIYKILLWLRYAHSFVKICLVYPQHYLCLQVTFVQKSKYLNTFLDDALNNINIFQVNAL